MADFNLLKIDGKLAEPFTRLVEKFCDGIGVLYDPRHTREQAQAKADADKILAESEIEITAVQRRGLSRSIQEEGKKQENIENLLLEAGPHLNEDAKPEDIESDWIANLSEKIKIVSDKEMQILWAKLLAGEANNPGTFSKRTVNFVGDLDKSDADLFTKFCSFLIYSGGFLPVIYDINNPIYEKNGVTFNTLTHLDEIGLITYVADSHFFTILESKTANFSYFDMAGVIEFDKTVNNKFKYGVASLSKIGAELNSIANGKPVDGFYEYLLDEWKKLGYKTTAFPVGNKADPE